MGRHRSPLLRTWARTLGPAAAAALAVLAACSSADVQGPSEGPPRIVDAVDDVLFLTQSAAPSAAMDALFEGRVDRDAAGCLRLDLDDRHTVIWPAGFTVAETAGGELRILDGDGREVGRVGERFRLGGGEVTTLHEGIPMTEADRRAALERCPGRYWIVGDTY